MNQFFTRPDIAQGHESDVAAYPEIRCAGMICVKHGSFTLFRRHRRNKEIVIDLNLDRSERGGYFLTKKFPGHNMAAFNRDDFMT